MARSLCLLAAEPQCLRLQVMTLCKQSFQAELLAFRDATLQHFQRLGVILGLDARCRDVCGAFHGEVLEAGPIHVSSEDRKRVDDVGCMAFGGGDFSQVKF